MRPPDIRASDQDRDGLRDDLHQCDDRAQAAGGTCDQNRERTQKGTLGHAATSSRTALRRTARAVVPSRGCALNRRSRSAVLTTDTLEAAIASPAMTEVEQAERGRRDRGYVVAERRVRFC